MRFGAVQASLAFTYTVQLGFTDDQNPTEEQIEQQLDKFEYDERGKGFSQILERRLYDIAWMVLNFIYYVILTWRNSDKTNQLTLICNVS